MRTPANVRVAQVPPEEAGGKVRRRLDLFLESRGMPGGGAAMGRPSTVKVLEAGIVGSLDYKIITAERADDLFAWLKENKPGGPPRCPA